MRPCPIDLFRHFCLNVKILKIASNPLTNREKKRIISLEIKRKGDKNNDVLQIHSYRPVLRRRLYPAVRWLWTNHQSRVWGLAEKERTLKSPFFFLTVRFCESFNFNNQTSYVGHYKMVTKVTKQSHWLFRFHHLYL